MTPNNKSSIGPLYALGAFLLWGLLPLYWKLLKAYPPYFILMNRIVWSAVFLTAFTVLRGEWKGLSVQLKKSETWIWLLPSTLVIAANWGLYIWAVNSGYVLETSLGYFLNPLVNVFLGYLFLGERLRKWQRVALFLVIVSVANSLCNYGRLPWIALFLAISFGFYGLFKKKMKADALVCLTVETGLLLIPCGIVLVASPAWSLQPSFGMCLLLAGSGIVTALPLYYFAQAAKHLNLSTLGVFQYLAPSIQFLLAIFAFNEPLNLQLLLSFVLIWIALAIYAYDSLSLRKKNKRYSKSSD